MNVFLKRYCILPFMILSFSLNLSRYKDLSVIHLPSFTAWSCQIHCLSSLNIVHDLFFFFFVTLKAAISQCACCKSGRLHFERLVFKQYDGCRCLISNGSLLCLLLENSWVLISLRRSSAATLCDASRKRKRLRRRIEGRRRKLGGTTTLSPCGRFCWLSSQPRSPATAACLHTGGHLPFFLCFRVAGLRRKSVGKPKATWASCDKRRRAVDTCMLYT